MNETILFVDDDELLLEGLKRMLRSKRGEWEMTFVPSAFEALAILEKQCHSVVIADMRMPELSGAQLLARVKTLCPRSVRIILSGQADLSSTFDSIDSAHQYLSKPCDAEELKGTIDRASRLRGVLKDDRLEAFIAGLKQIPSARHICTKLKRELSAAKPSPENVIRIAAEDIGITAKLLQLVNSSFFGPKRTVCTLRDSVAILGLDLLRKLILDHDILAPCQSDSPQELAIQSANSECVGFSEAPLLLRDIGKILLCHYDPERYSQVLDAGPSRNDQIRREFELFGASRVSVGAYLLGLWGIPSLFVKQHDMEAV